MMTSKRGSTKTLNGNFHKAREAKNDEFYTRLADIEKELFRYSDHFAGKVVYLNCDDPETSNFWVYFTLKFEFLGLAGLISTHYTGEGSRNSPPSYMLELTPEILAEQGVSADKAVPRRVDLAGDGDFRSDECIALLERCDIVVTNPPFSCYREYIAQLIEYEKDFIVLGNRNAVTYREIWPLIEEGKMWLGGYPGTVEFEVPAHRADETKWGYRVDSEGRFFHAMRSVVWFTNLDIDRRHEEIPLALRYSGNEDEYPTYDEYDAINVSKVSDIPLDYDGVMGVPVTFLGKHNPDQFDIVGLDRYVPDNPHPGRRFHLSGKEVYARILIRAVNPSEAEK